MLDVGRLAFLPPSPLVSRLGPLVSPIFPLPVLFNSYTYLLLFLPLALLGFQLLRRAPLRVALGWLVLMSLVYYGWWNPTRPSRGGPGTCC